MRWPLILIAGTIALFAAGMAVPFRVTHHLDKGCRWQAAHSLSLVGRASPSPDDQQERSRCLMRRGLKSASPEIKIWLRKWPHDHRNTLHAPEPTSSLQGSDRR